MIDYILNFTDEATAHLALTDWRGTDLDGNGIWITKPKCGIMFITVINAFAVYDNTDPMNPVLTTPAVIAGGYWMALASPAVDDALWAQTYCMSEHDRELGVQGKSHMLRTKLTQAQLDGVAGITPVFAGTAYPFA